MEPSIPEQPVESKPDEETVVAVRDQATPLVEAAPEEAVVPALTQAYAPAAAAES